MWQFINKTAFPGTLYMLPDESGVDTVFAVLKATYTIAPKPQPAPDQLPLVLADEYHGVPGESSIRTPSNVSLRKPGTDVLLRGFAYAPPGSRASAVDVRLRVGAGIDKTLRVHGDRTWSGAAPLWRASAPAPFEVMPLTWERASGAPANPFNPVGCTAQCPPNVEIPARPAQSPDRLSAPGGFGPVAPAWEPRRCCAGTYDEAWRTQRAPYLPADFNPWFFQLAPRDQVVQGYLKGGEPVALAGALPGGGSGAFYLPRMTVDFGYLFDTGREVSPADLDTVDFDTGAMVFTMTWRAAVHCDKRALRLREVQVRLR